MYIIWMYDSLQITVWLAEARQNHWCWSYQIMNHHLLIYLMVSHNMFECPKSVKFSPGNIHLLPCFDIIVFSKKSCCMISWIHFSTHFHQIIAINLFERFPTQILIAKITVRFGVNISSASIHCNGTSDPKWPSASLPLGEVSCWVTFTDCLYQIQITAMKCNTQS